MTLIKRLEHIELLQIVPIFFLNNTIFISYCDIYNKCINNNST